MKNIKKFSVAALIIVTSLLSQSVVASSFPAVGAGVDNSAGSSGSQSSSSSSGYIAPISTPIILGGDGLTPTTAYDVTTDFDSYSPYTDANGISYYVLASGGGFNVGNYIKDINGDIYILQDAGNGYLKAVLQTGTGSAGLGDGTVFFLLPVGNGNIILAILILTYGFYIFYRKKKKEKASVEVKKSYPLG
ncbi:MAG: hypothetical protein P4L28_03205 [Paludibacteraceae bacterium]|nr:hypothetical protein [Paludibacteraceae bacterium]